MKDFLTVAKAVADESRARILLFLSHGELCVCQIVEMLELAPSTVSKHLSVLGQAGLIQSRKDGRWIYYRLARKDASPAAREAIRWAQGCLDEDPRIVADAKRLKAVRRTNAQMFCCHYHKG